MQRNSLLSRFALFTALTVIAAAVGFSQAFYGSVVGTITDPSGGALTGAAVTLTNAATGERRTQRLQDRAVVVRVHRGRAVRAARGVQVHRGRVV